MLCTCHIFVIEVKIGLWPLLWASRTGMASPNTWLGQRMCPTEPDLPSRRIPSYLPRFHPSLHPARLPFSSTKSRKSIGSIDCWLSTLPDLLRNPRFLNQQAFLVLVSHRLPTVHPDPTPNAGNSNTTIHNPPYRRHESLYILLSNWGDMRHTHSTCVLDSKGLPDNHSSPQQPCAGSDKRPSSRHHHATTT